MIRRLLFEHWYFRGQTPWDTGISPPELLEFIETHNPGRAIDLGCGTGTNVITLARAGWQVTGIDFAWRAIRKAKRKAAAARVLAELYVRDATRLVRIKGPFELAFDLGCFHGILQNRRADYLAELDRILVPGGYWLLYAFLTSEPDHAQPTVSPPASGRRPHGANGRRAFGPNGGLDEAAVQALSARFTLLSRQDGFDNRGRNSAWFLFRKHSNMTRAHV
jgi:SAM-dependent methyltransferase